jgi:hypothetical protein
MGRLHAQVATPVRQLLLLLAPLVLLLVPATALADGGACSVTGTSTSGGSVDLLATPVWHLRSTDQVTVTAVADSPQADVFVSVYAFGYAIPVANGSSSGGETVAEADYDVATLARIGRIFVAAGSSSGPFGACGGDVVVVLDDVSPLGTALGIGSVGASVLGLAGIAWGVRNPASRGRRVTSLVSALLLLGGGSVIAQQTADLGEKASLGPSAIAAAVAGPAQVSLDPLTLAEAAGLALLIVLVMPFPAELFNRTLEGNLDRIRGAVRRIPLLGLLAGREAPASTRSGSRTFGAIAFILVAGLLYGLLDPTFGPDVRSAVTFVGIVAALGAVTWLQGLPLRAAHQAASPDGTDRGHLQAALGTLAVAAACVLISRATGFLPGYLYGLVIGYQFVRELDGDREARALSASAWWMLGLAVVCWLMLNAVRAPGVAETAPGQILSTVLGTITVAGIEGIVFGLVPLRFLPGEPIFRWSRVSWAVLYAIGLFGFVWIILDPANGFANATDQAGFVTAAVLFIGFGLVSVLFWAYFRLRPSTVAAKSQ